MFDDAPGGGAPGGAEGDATSGGAPAPDAGAWQTGLSEENRSHMETKGYESPDALATAYRNLEGKIGEKGLILPKDDAPDAEWSDVYTALGRPESAEGYTFAMPEGREASEADTAFHGEMGKIFHGANITARQAGKLNEGWNAMVDSMNAAQAQRVKDADTALRAEWGGDHDKNIAISTDGARKAFGDGFEDAKALQLAGGVALLDHPSVIRAMYTVGLTTVDDQGNPVPDGGTGGTSVADAKTQREQLMGDEAFTAAMLNDAHKDHKDALAKMNRLDKIIAGAAA